MPGPPLGILVKSSLPSDLLVGEAERAMVGGNHLQVVVLQAVPELGLMLLGRAAAE